MSTIEKFPSLPPLHVSRLMERVSDVDQSSALEKVEYVVGRASLISDEASHPFKKQGERKLGEYHLVSYAATCKNRDPLFYALEEEVDDDDSELQRQVEFLFFLVRGPQEIFVLSTSRAYKQIRGFCSQTFPKQLSTKLYDKLIRVDQVVTGALLGPISESNQSIRDFLPVTVEQSGLTCREITLITQPFLKCLPGSQVKIKFKEHGLVIYRQLTIADYAELTEFSRSMKISHEWGISDLPKEFTPVTDQQVLHMLEERLLVYMIGDPLGAVKNVVFDFALSNRMYTRASEFRILVTRGKDINDYSYSINFEDPYYPLNLDELRGALTRNYGEKWCNNFVGGNRSAIENAFKNKKVRVEYKVDDVWLSHDVFESVEGWVKLPDNHLFFRMGGHWHTVQEGYETKVDQALGKILSGNSLATSDEGYLYIPWPKDMKEEPYNCLYANIVDRQNSLWLEGNKKRKSLGCEIGDIFLAKGNNLFIYHVKKHFNNTIRDAVTQLVMSAQLVRSNLAQGGYQNSALKEYCDVVGGEKNRERFLQAFTTNKLHFVIAFPQPDFQHSRLLNSGSITAKRELIRAKEEIEKLGFEFRICVIKQT